MWVQCVASSLALYLRTRRIQHYTHYYRWCAHFGCAVVDWTDPPTANLNGLVRFADRPNLVSARVPSRFKRAILAQWHSVLISMCRARFKRDGTCAETRFALSAKRTSPFKLAEGQLSRLLAAEVCASAVVMVVMLDAPCSEVECKTTDYPLHSRFSPSLPLPFVTVCHQVSAELYFCFVDNWNHNMLKS